MKIKAKSSFKEFRAKRGYSIHGLAEAAGVSYRTVFRLENKHPVFPKTTRKICNALNCEFDDVFIIDDV